MSKALPNAIGLVEPRELPLTHAHSLAQQHALARTVDDGDAAFEIGGGLVSRGEGA